MLIGASRFTAAGLDLPDIPAVAANLTALRQVLISPDTGVLRPESCRVLPDPTSADEIGTALSDLAATATDLLLVYYAGHGLVDDRGRLHLALAHTQPQRARWTALPLDLLREEIATSTAATCVLVLDCCFSGRAIDAMADNQSVITGQLDVAGTYTLTSTTANAPSHAPAGDRYTAFTGALLRALNHADPLTLDQIYTRVDRDLVARNLPRPQRRAINATGDLALSRGPTSKHQTDRPDPDTSRSDSPYPLINPELHLEVFRSPGGTMPRLLRNAFVSFLLPIALFIILLPISVLLFVGSLLGLFVADDSTAVFLLLVSGGLLALSAWLYRLVPSGKGIHAHELVVDRSGLTLATQRPAVRTHLAWQDVAQVGVLQAERRLLNQRVTAAQYKRKPLLVVQLRPEIPIPDVMSVLSDEHLQLGYLGLCALDDIGSSQQEMINALERFAGDRLVRSPRQFLDRDPRLRPGMV